jgi:hypothetical protein
MSVSLRYPGSNANIYFNISNKEGEEKKGGKNENGVMRDATFKEEGTQSYSTLKVPKQCPFVLLAKG